MDDVAGFLRSHPPFDAVEGAALARLAAVTETEASPGGKTIFAQGAGPVEYLRVVRSGSVEIIHNGLVLDLLGPGELFGHASMLSGLPTGFEARAAEDTVCYRIPAAAVSPLLGRPPVLRFIARSLAEPAGGATAPADPVQRPVAALIRARPVLCSPAEPIREAARRMTEEGASAVLVLAGPALGIVTDRDLRSRVVAGGVGADAPVSAIMTAPAFTASADRLGGDVLLEMLDRGVHHVPVVSATGEVLGVVDDGDLVAAQARTPFVLRRAIGAATTTAELAAAAAGLGPMTMALHDARVAAGHIAAIRAVVVDALIRRLAGFAVSGAGSPPVPFTWFALGSLARRETVPSSDIDSALSWDGGDGDGPAAARAYCQRVAAAVDAGLQACGLRADAHGSSAASPLFARSAAAWREAVGGLARDPARDRALILVSVITDSRPVWESTPGTAAAAGDGPAGPAGGAAGDGGVAAGGRPAPRPETAAAPFAAGSLWQGRASPDLLRLLARFALSFRPPTGFLRDFVVEHSGERRGQLDIKHGGLIPIVDLARWAGIAAGAVSSSTEERLRAAEAAGTLAAPEARTLVEAYGFIFSLRLAHQVEQVRRGEPPDDFVDPKTLNPLARSYLKEAFRAVASVQSGLANELALGARWG